MPVAIGNYAASLENRTTPQNNTAEQHRKTTPATICFPDTAVECDSPGLRPEYLFLTSVCSLFFLHHNQRNARSRACAKLVNICAF
jgi:hypothetical protein